MNTSAYIFVVFGIFIAKCLGFLRDIVFASVFGASTHTDIYFQIFSLASLIFTAIGGALSTLIIKNLNKKENSSFESQKNYVKSFITKSFLVCILACVFLYAFSPYVVKLLLPGLDNGMHHEAIKIMHIMIPSCVFVIIAYIISGVLQNNSIFFITSIMSFPYNVAIISALLFKGIDIEKISIVTTIGWFLHIVILLPSFYKKGFSLFGKPLKQKDKSYHKEIIYIFISSMMFQLVFMMDKACVTNSASMASSINYASNLFVTISSVFVVAMSSVSYPSLSRNYENGDFYVVRKLIGYILIVLFAIMIPFILCSVIFGKDIISLLYQRGEFTKEMSIITGSLFSIYAFGVFGYICQELLNKVLYLDKKYNYTIFATFFVIAFKYIFNFVIPFQNVKYVAMSTSIIFGVYAFIILFGIIKSVGNYFTKDFIKRFLKIMLSAILSFIGLLVIRCFNINLGAPIYNLFFELGVCALIYIGTLIITGIFTYILKKGENQ